MLDATHTTEIERLPGESVTDFAIREIEARAAASAAASGDVA